MASNTKKFTFLTAVILTVVVFFSVIGSTDVSESKQVYRFDDDTTQTVSNPLRVNAKMRPDNELRVYLHSVTEKGYYDIKIKPVNLPEGWQITDGYKGMKILPPGRATSVSLHIEAPPNAGPEIIDFKFISDQLNFPFSARVHPHLGEKEQLSDTLEVYGNYPNPVSSTTSLSYYLPDVMDEHIHVKAGIYTPEGQQITKLSGHWKPGLNNIVFWNTSEMSSGTYLYRIVAEGDNGQRLVSAKKMVLIK